jgi:von Willebrand factor type A domain
MTFSTVRRSFFVAIPALAAALAISCGGSDTSNVTGGDGTGASNTGTGGSINLNTSGNGSLQSSGGSVMTIGRDAACADGSGVGDAIPAVVEMVIDISGSMLWGADGNHRPPRGMTKWDITSAALKAAVAKLPASIAVGINFFPNNPARNSCIRNRIDLPIALLGANNSAQRRGFNTAIDNANPSDGTPTHAAFKFGAETVAASKLNGRKFVLLITDGIPTYPLDCSGDGMAAVDNQPLIDEVATASTSAISTFVIGSPGSEDARSDLSQMASKGGTAKAGCADAGPNYCHLDMTTATDFGAALTAGLADVAGQIGTCEFTVPPAPAGKTLDPKLVNVLYTQTDGTESSIPQDAKGDCASGWKYDDDNAPTKITLCGSDCDRVKADGGAKIDVIFGCTTETNVPVK